MNVVLSGYPGLSNSLIERQPWSSMAVGCVTESVYLTQAVITENITQEKVWSCKHKAILLWHWDQAAHCGPQKVPTQLLWAAVVRTRGCKVRAGVGDGCLWSWMPPLQSFSTWILEGSMSVPVGEPQAVPPSPLQGSHFSDCPMALMGEAVFESLELLGFECEVRQLRQMGV